MDGIAVEIWSSRVDKSGLNNSELGKLSIFFI